MKLSIPKDKGFVKDSNLPKAIQLYKGLSIYRVSRSKLWYVRIWDRKRKRYLVKSTGFEDLIRAKESAQQLGISLLREEPKVDKDRTFDYFALLYLKKLRNAVNRGDKSEGYAHSMRYSIENSRWGLVSYFGGKDITKIKTLHYEQYIDLIGKKNGLKPSTKNTVMAGFRNVMKEAVEEGLIDFVPSTPRTKMKDSPRPFFRFAPLVNKEDDNYKKLLEGIKSNYGKIRNRALILDDEMYDLCLFCVHSFVRPTMTELYGIKHSDVTIADNPKRLLLTIRDGKTGYRVSNTLEAAVSIYNRIKERHKNNFDGEDYIFYRGYKNRQTISAMVQRLFKSVLDELDLRVDKFTNQNHSMYSLRHTAICMRIVLSEGQVNIYNLARNAGTSVGQIERFYAKHLPLSAELARNLQSFGQ
tara:strand:+ start:161 stop:1402 length:1242 start_codon:yes stop_codon:yes gene_type:complete